MTKVTVTLVTWNSSRVLRPCLESLQQQTFKDFHVVVVDNASIDDSREIVRQLAPEASLIQSPRNVGFGRAHNQAIHLTQSPYILCLNPDTQLTPNALETLVSTLDNEAMAAAVGPKLLRYRLTDDEFDPVEQTTVIDSTGIVQRANGLFRERGANAQDNGQFDQGGEVFAVSAAAALYRRGALDSVAVAGEYFDADFFAYKEDVDLGWRLRRQGWKSLYEPRAVIYHRRTFQEAAEAGQPRAVAKSRRQRDQRIRRLSYRNHLLLLAKNLTWNNWKQLPLIFATEAAKLIFLLFTEPRTLLGLGAAWKLFPTMRRKRPQTP